MARRRSWRLRRDTWRDGGGATSGPATVTTTAGAVHVLGVRVSSAGRAVADAAVATPPVGTAPPAACAHGTRGSAETLANLAHSLSSSLPLSVYSRKSFGATSRATEAPKFQGGEG